jgi:hypothetical protein
VGLEILLQNLEAAAEGAASPPRFLMCHFPGGTLRERFLPIGDRTNFAISPILRPFETAGLVSDLIILYGLAHRNQSPGGGGIEAGTVFSTTGADSPGTRANGGESDDSVAGGPSFDQIFLKKVPALQRPGAGYINVTCDARVDSFETSARSLSYSYQRQTIPAANPQGSMIEENIPLLPMLAPANVYASLFSKLVPGTNMESAALRALRLRKSVLDSSLRELGRLQTLAPASQRDKIEIHTDAIRKAERALEAQIDAASGGPSSCEIPLRPDPNLSAKFGSMSYYGNPKAPAGDEATLAQLGKLHFTLIRAAFQCDLLRVATFQWCPGTNQVAFEGMYPLDPSGAYRFHPMMHRATAPNFFAGPPPSADTEPDDSSLYEFISSGMTWFNQGFAEALAEFKTAKDAFGNSLLDYTVVPLITEIADGSNRRSPLPALIVGGRRLGMLGGQYVNTMSAPISHNALWLSVAQAYFPDVSPAEALRGEDFMQSPNTATAPIDGLWMRPS